MDERTAEYLLYLDATLTEIAGLVERGRLIKGMRNRIAHDYLTVDDDIVWAVVEHHATHLHHALNNEIATAKSTLQTDEQTR